MLARESARCSRVHRKLSVYGVFALVISHLARGYQVQSSLTS
jgi:hypothetical protein